MMTWGLIELAKATQGELHGFGQEKIKGFCTDSRDVQPGDLYVAIKGAVHDGHQFINDVFEKGAVAALAEDMPDNPKGPIILVPNVVEGLAHLGHYQRAHLTSKILAVTGSAGKTSTKELLKYMLSAQGKTHASSKSFNTKYGVPISMALCEKDCQYAIFEIGMSKAGEIANLVQIVRPHISIITTIAAAHIESFGNLEGIADAKAEIFQGMSADGIAIVNGDVLQSVQLCRRAREQGIQTIIQFGEEVHCESRLLEYRPGEDFNIIKADILGMPIEFKLYPKGKHWAMNTIAALTAVHFAGGDIQKASNDIGGYRPVTGRGDEISLKHNILVVDESYNANPASMEASIASFFERTVKGRRILVLGSMAELGALAETEHGNLGKLLGEYSADEVFLCGDEMKFAQKAYGGKAKVHFYKTLDECISGVLGHVHAGDSIMVKARRSMQLDKVVTALKQHFGTP
jgi:UDP-N-acetylmuramoyl-tripeptide--D-alanyl-D-alanine ligase